MPHYVFSLNGENWSGAHETREAALAAAIQKCSGASDPPGTVYVAEIAPGQALADSLGKTLVNELRARARARGNEGDGRYLREVSAAQVRELDALVEKTVVGWVQKHELMPSSFKVEAISEHSVPLPHRGLSRASNNGREVHDLGVGEFPG